MDRSTVIKFKLDTGAMANWVNEHAIKATKVKPHVRPKSKRLKDSMDSLLILQVKNIASCFVVVPAGNKSLRGDKAC